MLSGMARRAAKGVIAPGQEELGSSREERVMEQGEAVTESRVVRGATRQTSGPRKSGKGDAEGAGKATERRDGEKAGRELEEGERNEQVKPPPDRLESS